MVIYKNKENGKWKQGWMSGINVTILILLAIKKPIELQKGEANKQLA